MAHYIIAERTPSEGVYYLKGRGVFGAREWSSRRADAKVYPSQAEAESEAYEIGHGTSRVVGAVEVTA